MYSLSEDWARREGRGVREAKARFGSIFLWVF